MSLPQATPLLLTSEYNATVTSAQFTTANLPALLAGIVRASEFIQRMFGRRFDESIAIRRYDCFLERDGGDLLDNFTLKLDNDLKAVIQFYQRVPYGDGVVITDGVEIPSSVYRLLFDSPQVGTPITVYNKIHISRYSGQFFYAGGIDPYESIWLNARWGYGGQWISTGTTLSGDINASVTSMTVASGTNLEAGMTFKLDSEYLYCESVSTNTVTIDRAFNGSTAAAHTSGATLYRWEAMPTVKDLIARLIQWRIEQIKAPAAGNVTVGDFTFPVDMGGLPKDLYLIMREAHLERTGEAYGV